MIRRLLFAGAVAVAASGCTEILESDVGCPALCPQDVVAVQTITIEPVILDTTVHAIIAPGSDPLMLLASRGDTLDSRVIVRFDTLPDTYIPSAEDTVTRPITEIHDAFLSLRIFTEEGLIADPTTIEAFNVDTTAADTDFAALLPLFRPDRRIGGGTFTAEELTDTDSVRVPLDSAALLDLIQTTARMRVGLRVSGPTSVQFLVFAGETGFPPLLTFRPDPDTAIAPFTIVPGSLSPLDLVELRLNLADYVIHAHTPPQGPPTNLNVGGLPAQRGYLRFEIPPFILDTATVVRATLLLTQRPNPLFAPVDTMGITVDLVVAGPAVTDIRQAAMLVADASFTGTDTLFVVPAESRVHGVDIATYLRFWRSVDRTQTPPAVVLASTREGGSPLEAWFYGTDAAPELRPRLRISFAPRPPVGLP